MIPVIKLFVIKDTKDIKGCNVKNNYSHSSCSLKFPGNSFIKCNVTSKWPMKAWAVWGEFQLQWTLNATVGVTHCYIIQD